MDEMGIEAIYPKPNLSKARKQHPCYPYLLRNFIATRPNQAWSIDITYIRLRHTSLKILKFVISRSYQRTGLIIIISLPITFDSSFA